MRQVGGCVRARIALESPLRLRIALRDCLQSPGVIGSSEHQRVSLIIFAGRMRSAKGVFTVVYRTPQTHHPSTLLTAYIGPAHPRVRKAAIASSIPNGLISFPRVRQQNGKGSAWREYRKELACARVVLRVRIQPRSAEILQLGDWFS